MTQDYKKAPKIRIAYVDDNIIFRKGMCGLLEQYGNIIVQIQADNGTHLIELLKDAEQLPDVCLIDINMPEMNGFELTPQLRRQWPGLGILAYSSWEDEYNTMQMINKGANGYMVKGYPVEELIKALNTVVEKGVFCTEAVDETFYKLARPDASEEPELSSEERDLMLHFSKFDVPRSDLPALLDMTEEQVENTKMSLFQKLHVRSRAGIALFAMQTGFMTADLS